MGVARLVFGLALFIVGALAGAVVGAKLFAFLQQGQGSVVLAVLFVAATGFVAGVATRRYRGTVLAAACSLGGAGLVLSGLARAFPQTIGFLRTPQTPTMAALGTLIWIVLAVLGWALQHSVRPAFDSRTGKDPPHRFSGASALAALTSGPRHPRAGDRLGAAR